MKQVITAIMLFLALTQAPMALADYIVLNKSAGTIRDAQVQVILSSDKPCNTFRYSFQVSYPYHFNKKTLLVDSGCSQYPESSVIGMVIYDNASLLCQMDDDNRSCVIN